MRRNTRVGMAALVAAPFIGLIATGAAMAESQVCTVNTARVAANNGDYDTLCECSQVTRGFVSYLQKRSDFDTILQNTSTQCLGLAELLTDLPTATISNTSFGEDRSSDRSNSTSEAGGAGISDNDSGGDTDSGNNSGNDSGDTPGDGGGEPGDGGGKPGKGGGKGGHGSDKPGSGGHGDKPGKGNGKGGAKGNNGGGNGAEGASPGRGKNANNDEG